MSATKFAVMADELIKSKDRIPDINIEIRRYANKKGLNTHETQRLIEEYNVGMFLQKMKEGTHHEEYDVADPVEIPTIGEDTSPARALKKTASFIPTNGISEDMFIISDDTHYEDALEKVASFDDSYHEEALEEKEHEKHLSAVEAISGDIELEKQAFLNDVVSAAMQDIVETTKHEEGLVKTAAILLVKEGMWDEAEELIMLSKHSSSEILESKAMPLDGDQKRLIGLLKEAKMGNCEDVRKCIGKPGYFRGLGQDLKGGATGVFNVLKLIVKHPFLTGGTAAGAYYMHSKRGNRPDIERLRMSSDMYD